MNLIRVLFLKCILICSMGAFQVSLAQKTIDLHPQKTINDLGMSLEILEDKTKSIDIQQVINKSFTGKFQASKSTQPNFAYTDAVYWFRFRLNNPSQYADWTLAIEPAHLDSIEIYFVQENKIYLQKSGGDMYSPAKREITYNYFVCKLPSKLDSNTTILVRIASQGSNKRFNIKVLTKEKLFQNAQINFLFVGFYSGVCWVMILYNLFLFFSLRERSYFYYISFIFSIWASQLLPQGFFQFVFPTSLYFLLNMGDLLCLGLATLTSSFFTLYFLNLKQVAPKTVWFVYFRIGLGIIIILLSMRVLYQPSTHLGATQITALFSLFSALLSFILGWVAWQKKYRPARFYLLAWTLFYLGTFTYIFALAGFLPIAIISFKTLEVGAMLQMVLLSMGLADRINIIKKEKENAKDQVIKALQEKDEFILAQNQVLEEKVIERTERIIQEQKNLEIQNQKLFELNEEKNNLISIVSHDLKSPLNRILGLTELVQMEEERLSTEQKDYLTKMSMVANQASEMIKQLLDLDTIENKKRELVWEEIHLPDTLASLVSNYRESAEKKEIKIYFENSINNPNLRSDKQYLNRIFDNLLSNALKFSPLRRNVYIKLKDRDNQVIIEFKDEGRGISSDDQSKLFRKFQRLSNQPTGGETSTGLGLAIVKALVDELKGEVACESEMGKGTNFIVELPRNI